MIRYNLQEKTQIEQSPIDYLSWLILQGDSIQILPSWRDGFHPLITIFQDKQRVSYHGVKASAEEMQLIDSYLPAMRKTDNSINLRKVKL